MTNPSYHKNVKPPTKKKSGRKINGDLYTATSTGKKKKERKRNGETQNKDRTRFTERVQKTPLNPTMGHQRSEGTKSERSNI